MSFVKKENIVISEEYTDGQGNIKKNWRTIGELITLNGQNGQFQKVKLWGPGGFQEASIMEPKDNNPQQPPQQQPQQGYAQQPQQGYAHPQSYIPPGPPGFQR